MEPEGAPLTPPFSNNLQYSVSMLTTNSWSLKVPPVPYPLGSDSQTDWGKPSLSRRLCWRHGHHLTSADASSTFAYSDISNFENINKYRLKYKYKKKFKSKYKHRAPSKRYNLTFADTSSTIAHLDYVCPGRNEKHIPTVTRSQNDCRIEIHKCNSKTSILDWKYFWVAGLTLHAT